MTKTIYEEVPTENGQTQIKKTDPTGVVSWIPTTPANTDYQDYLKTLK